MSGLTAAIASARLAESIRERSGVQHPAPRAVRAGMLEELRRVESLLPVDPTLHAAWSDGVDVPGEAYETLMSPAARRTLGQFQTPFIAADIMGGWLARAPVNTLVDPGVGTGRLLFRSARQGVKPARFVGFDIDSVSLAMARANLRARRVEGELHRGDFLLDDAGLSRVLHTPPDALIANPPFSRHHTLSAQRKRLLHERVKERLGIRLSGYAGLHIFFLLRALEITASDARLAFLTPAGWLDVDYGRAAKEYLVRNARVEAVVLFGSQHELFPNVATTAAITLLRKGGPSDGETRVVRVEQSTQVEDVLAAIEGAGTSLPVSMIRLTAARRWAAPTPRQRRGKPLESVARVRRGIATGNNSFFVLSEATRLAWGIEREWLRPCLYRPRLFTANVITDDDVNGLDAHVPRWLVNSPHADHDEFDDGLGRYLRWGIAECRADQSYLATHRQVWHQPEQRGDARIVLPYMHRGLPRLIRNESRGVPLNTFHVIEPLEDADTDALWAALNRSRVREEIRRLGRDYGRGLWKIEPRALRELRIRF